MNSMTLEEIKFIANHLTYMVMLADDEDNREGISISPASFTECHNPSNEHSRHRNCRRLQSTTMFVQRRITSIR